MAGFKTLEDFDLAGKRVLVRVDLNVPVSEGTVTDATRIERIVPTLRAITKTGAKAILMSHFGRPKGKVNPEYSLEVTLPAIAKAFGHEAIFVPTDWVDVAEAKAAIDAAPEGSVLVLENTRFHPGEEKNDPELTKKMAGLGDFYVNDAFSAAHRAHASTEGVARLLPAAAGRAMEAELDALEKALTAPQRPLLALVGGAKISTKLDLLGNLSKKVDGLIIGGGMANTFLAAKGVNVGKSLCEHDLAETARRIMDEAAAAGCEIILPTDAVVAREFAENAANETVAIDAVPDDAMILDIGPQSAADLCARLEKARTRVWARALGALEIAPFDAGTNQVARRAMELTAQGKLVSVAGGGDTVAALKRAGAADGFSYVSTAGGAFLEWLEGKELPGVKVLMTHTS